MLRHEDIWNAIDRLAKARGYSASGLARAAGLDPTAFNKSKRFSASRPRWPSTESIAKILDVTSTSFADFAGLVDGAGDTGQSIPVIGWDEAARPGAFDARAHPTGNAWRNIQAPDFADSELFAIEMPRADQWPHYGQVDILFVSLGAEARAGDRVFLRLRSGETIVGRLRRRSTEEAVLIDLPERSEPVFGSERVFKTDEIVSMQRIDWIGR